MIVNEAQVAAALPGYELGAQLGRGAFGLVLAARHRRLRRPVAVKIVPAGHSEAPAGSAGEAQLLASLDHPHIVRVYDYLEAGDLHLIVMELLDGGTLARCQERGMAPEQACAATLAAAAALACAHAHGVLHRDVKPDNMLFDAAGLLKVTDFGIAKIVEGSAATASRVVGTPAYMAPEQIRGRRLGPATDIYALGAVLYKLLAGSPPFDPTQGTHALWRHHLATTPAPPAGVPASVARVVLRALAKDPADRHASAHVFALDLAAAAARAFGPRWTARSGLLLRLDDDVRAAADDHQTAPAPPPPPPPAQAPPPVPIPAAREPPTMRRADDHPPEPLGGDTGEGVPGSSPRQLASEIQPAVRPPAAGTGPGRLAPRQSPTPGRVPTSGQVAGLDSARRRLPAPGRVFGRPWPRRLSAIVVLLLVAVTGTVLVARSRGDGPGSNPVGARPAGPATSSVPPTSTPTDLPTLRPLGAPLQGHTNGVNSVAFAPDGNTLASVGGIDDPTVRLWDVADRANPRPLATLEIPGRSGGSVVFAPDGNTLVSVGGVDAATRLWDVADRANPRPFATLEIDRWVYSVAFTPDGDTLASGGTGRAVRLWDVADRANPRRLATLEGHTNSVRSVAFAPDGRTLVSVDDDRTMRLWDMADQANPRRLAALEMPGRSREQSVAFTPDGRTLVSIDNDRTVRLWDVADRANPRPLATLEGHTGLVLSVAFTPDGRTLASVDVDVDGSGDGDGGRTVRLWDMADRSAARPLATLEGHTDRVYSVAFAPDGRTLASGGYDGTVRLWVLR